MIKTVLTTAAAFALTAGVAFAQQTTPPAATKASDGTMTSVSSSHTTQSASGDSVNGTPAASASTPTGGAPMQNASMPSSPSTMANMPMGDAPSTYPMCTKKGQDRCKQRRAM